MSKLLGPLIALLLALPAGCGSAKTSLPPDLRAVSEIGISRSNGVDAMATKQVIIVRSGLARRIAVIERFDKRYAGPFPIKWVGGHVVPWETPELVAWIEPDHEAAALAAQRRRFGTVDTIYPGRSGVPEIDALAPRAASGVFAAR